jgi:hypothetical protein
MCRNELTVKFWTYRTSECFVVLFPVGDVTYDVTDLSCLHGDDKTLSLPQHERNKHHAISDILSPRFMNRT